jgi:DUF1680 family protein
MPTRYQPASVTSVRFTDGLLAERQQAVLKRSIDQQYDQCKTTGRLDAIKLKWKPGSTDVPKPHEFWDSDVAKWIESAAYALMLKPDAALEARVDAVVDDMAASQRADGYYNAYYLAVEPDKVFTNLRDKHELYCAGHLIEAAVAYFQATGKRKLLDVLTKYVDYIDSRFGPEPGKLNGYDGHEEIELALMRLYRVTNDPKHLKLARHFIDARGQGKEGDADRSHFFDREAVARGEDLKRKQWVDGYAYYQAHEPIRDQKAVEGHSVRALYMLSGAIDVAYQTGDKKLVAACKRLFDNCVERRMYVNGGVGSTRQGERFTFDFDLPNESAYAETCANISLVFAASRLLNRERDARYGDIVELALYNAVLPGISLDGTKYYYANYLATDPRWHHFERGYPADRHGWFGCACCPPNVARLLTSLAGYAYAVAKGEVAVHLYGSSTIEHEGVTLMQTTQYPWDGRVKFDVKGGATKLTLRLPGWCEKPTLTLNGKAVAKDVLKIAKKGYVTMSIKDGDAVELTLPMPVRRVYADVRVRHDVGRVTLFRGPILYCLEQKDNGPDLNAILLPEKAKVTAKPEPKLLGGVVTLTAPAAREANAAATLYGPSKPKRKPTALKAVPYYTWANRGSGEMIVWVREA